MTVGSAPVTCKAKLGHLMTSTEDTRLSMTRLVRGLLSMLIALALPKRRMVAFLHFVMRIDWEIETSTSIGAAGSSKFS